MTAPLLPPFKRPPPSQEGNHNSFVGRLRSLIGEESLHSFGERCDISASLLHRYLKGSIPGMDKLVMIARETGVSLDWLAAGHGSRQSDQISLATSRNKLAHNPDDYVFVPLYEVSASAGSGMIVDSDAEVSAFAFPPSWIRQTLRTSPQGLQMITVRGESMEPTLISGDIVLLDRKVTEVTEGIYVLRMEDSVFVKRLHLLPGKQLKVISDNPSYESFTLDGKSSPDDFAIIGKVIWSFHAH